MCGIVGLIDKSGEYSKSEVISRMADVMIKRGPDGYGEFVESPIAMAMRRLSVIDLEHGWQPFFSRNGQVVAFQNGEIYNFQELRRILVRHGYHFKSRSDTEVLAHGFAQWGIEGLLQRIDGMFAFAILDKREKTLFLARDRFGEKPLFYSAAEGKFTFSSNLRALIMLPWIKDEVEPKALDYYLALHYIPGEMTVFKSIKRVLPGEYLKIPLDRLSPEKVRYFRPDIRDTAQISDDALADLIEKCVESRLIADVPVGIFLSGGVDSSLIAAIAAKKQPHIFTFSMGFEGKDHDESPDAGRVAKTIGSTHYRFLFDGDNFARLLPEVAAALDEPVGDQAMLPLYWLCQEARKHVKVVLAGEGADEVFAGYSYYKMFLQATSWREKFAGWLKERHRAPKGKPFLCETFLTTPSGFPLLSDYATRRRLIGHDSYSDSNWEGELAAWLDLAEDPLRRATTADLTTWLSDDLLVKFDRMAMAHSLEGRAPYLHPAIVNAGLLLPQKHRMDNVASKIALRRIAARWLPREIVDKPKQGFVLPMRKWLKRWFDLHGCVTDYFASREVGFLNMNETINLVQRDVNMGISNERLIFALVLLFEWNMEYKRFAQTMKIF